MPGRVRAIQLVALLGAFVVGCGNEAQGPIGAAGPELGSTTSLTSSELDTITQTLIGAALSGINVDPTQNAPAPPSSADPIDIAFAIEAIADCAAGGAVEFSGVIQGTFDQKTQSGSFSVTATLVAKACRIPHDETVFTVSTDPDIQQTGDVVIEEGTVSGTFRLIGAFGWQSDDGRSGRCEVNLTIEFSDGQRTVTGMVCNQEVNKTT